jgi:hypothetical protein
MQNFLRVGIVASLLSVCGCGARSPATAENSEYAKYTLVAALGAWQSGKVDSLLTRTPAIRFVDDEQSAGMELIDYEFENEAAKILPFQNVAVALSLRDTQGRTYRKLAHYQVGVKPSLTVLRSDN